MNFHKNQHGKYTFLTCIFTQVNLAHSKDFHQRTLGEKQIWERFFMSSSCLLQKAHARQQTEQTKPHTAIGTCAVRKRRDVWNHMGCDWMFYKHVPYLVYLCTRHLISATFGSSFNTVLPAPHSAVLCVSCIRFFIMPKFAIKTLLVCARIWRRRIVRVGPALQAESQQRWVLGGLGDLGHKNRAFLKSFFPGAPSFFWRLRNKIQSEIIFRVSPGSEAWLLWCCCVFLFIAFV